MTESMLQIIVTRQSEDKPMALATIIATKGSTPCKAGTKMLIFPDGGTFGTIGGGCAEAEVRMRALTALDDGKPFVHTVSLLNDQAAQMGMVCGGIMDVFIQVV